jgi:exodeoxyribonuclease VII large subunit
MTNSASLSMTQQNVITVSELNRQTSQLLSEHFLSVWVAGEMSNLTMPSSGHWYFSLKDAQAQVRCALFRNQQRGLSIRPENGKQVIVKAQVSLYEPRGDYQLIVEQIEEAGDGALQKAFEALKQKLLNEGLFAPASKKKWPLIPKAIGVITSPSGAAVRDILTALKRRFTSIPVIIYPVAVQGANAKREIADALAAANRLQQCDVIILARGGGSIEDLWAFNEEGVARAIFASHIPVITGIGHETDVTIADFVADFRAATPTAAAEQVTPDQRQWLLAFSQSESRLKRLWQRQLNQRQQALDWLSQRLCQQHPGQQLSRKLQRIGELDVRLQQAVRSQLQRRNSATETKIAQLWQFDPTRVIGAYKQRQLYLSERLHAVSRVKLNGWRQRFLRASQTLHAVSPLATLGRGYALVRLQRSGVIIRSTAQLTIGDQTETQVAHGRFISEIKMLDP